MKVPGLIILRVTVLTLAFVIGGAPICGSNILRAFPPGRLVDLDGREAGDSNSLHKYTPQSCWDACGVIPYEGYEGLIGSHGIVWKCDDGAMVSVVEDNFMSPRGTEAERLARSNAKAPAHKPWRIEQTVSLGATTVVELTEPVSAGFEGGPSNRWVVIWTSGSSLMSIFGPDREHVMDFYQTRYGKDTKK